MPVCTRTLSIFLVGVLLIALSCSDRLVRGREVASPDGGTYLAINDDNGGACGPIRVDGEVWPAPLGEVRPVVAGSHRIACGDGPGLTFEVLTGTTLFFDDWGP